MTSRSTSASDADSVEAQPIAVRGAWGVEHAGAVARIDRFEGDVRRSLARAGHDFLILLASEPADGPPQSDVATVICSPASSLPSMVRETRPSYHAGPAEADVPLTPREIRLYRDGNLVSTTELDISPADVFCRSTVDFESLACELVRRRDEDQLMEKIARALSDPAERSHHKPTKILTALRRTLRHATACCKSLPEDVQDRVRSRLDRLRAVASARKPATAISAATPLYPDLHTLIEDIFLARALSARRDDAVRILRMQAFVEDAPVPQGADREVFLDYTSLIDRISFATLVSDPRQLPALIVAFDLFKRGYAKLYAAHHAGFWKKMTKLNQLLDDARPEAEALHRLNSISELTPALAVDSLVEYGSLVDDRIGCRLADAGADDLGDGPVCSECGITLADTPDSRAKDVVKRIERGLAGQMKRLASEAVRQLLQRSDDPRIDRFLKIVQASQVATLPDVLDDQLTGYLRRFLVEARLGLILEPLLTRVAHGAPPDRAEERAALRDIAGVLERALDNSRLALEQPRSASD